MSPLDTVTAKCMDCSGSSQNFTPMRHATRDEIFFSGPHRNSLALDDQGITTLHNDHVFVVIVGMWRGSCGLTAGPKCHLASVCSIEDKPLYAWSRLIGLRNFIGGMLHELGKIFHGRKSCPFLKTRQEVISPLNSGLSGPVASRRPRLRARSRHAGPRSAAEGFPGERRQVCPGGRGLFPW